jgi:hypothetical protein
MKSDFRPELESKRIEKAEIRTVVLAWTGTSLVVWALLILNRLHPSPAMRWIVLAALLPYGYLFYRLAQKTSKLKSVLPPEMEARRLKIGKRHNSLLLPLIIAMGALPIGAVWVGAAVIPGYNHAVLSVALAVTALMAGYGLYRVIQYDNALCRQPGYMCPNCHKPLYEPRAITYLNGLCPKCKKSVVGEEGSSMQHV